jgi:hypothetical protein
MCLLCELVDDQIELFTGKLFNKHSLFNNKNKRTSTNQKKSKLGMNYYKIISIATSLLFIYLFTQLLFMPEAFVKNLGMQPAEAASVLARRASMFMLGISVLMFAARNLSNSESRQIICAAQGITMFGLSFMGSYEFIRGTVNSSIFIAIICETILWVSFIIILLKSRKSQVFQ